MRGNRSSVSVLPKGHQSCTLPNNQRRSPAPIFSLFREESCLPLGRYSLEPFAFSQFFDSTFVRFEWRTRDYSQSAWTPEPKYALLERMRCYPICHNLPMCGRYRLSRREQIVEEHFDTASDAEDWSPRYNQNPKEPVPIIRQNPNEPVRELSLVRWGLIPSWAKDSSVAAKMINARSETASTNPAFRDALKSRRCLIPADGFYECAGGMIFVSPVFGGPGTDKANQSQLRESVSSGG
jgi:hypothetical protein